MHRISIKTITVPIPPSQQIGSKEQQVFVIAEIRD
jgi:hypothetical protein